MKIFRAAHGPYVGAFFLIAFLVWFHVTKRSQEEYTPSSASIAQSALSDVVTDRVKASPQSITRIVWTNVSIATKQKTFIESMNVINPRETVVFRGRPKYVARNAIVVGKWVTFETTGPTVREAVAAANAKASSILTEIRQILQKANLLASG